MKKINILLWVFCMIAAPVHAQQIKSLDEIEAASFQAGPAPFDKESVPVNLSEKSIKHANAHIDIFLDGEWQLIEGGSDDERLNGEWVNPIKAVVPGSVHTALWKAGIIPDPYFGRNDSIAEQYSYKTWYYKKEFSVDNILNAPRLIFGGIANKCTVWLNGVKLGNHEGMFGGPSFDVSKILKNNNVLIVKIDPIPEIFRNNDRNQPNESWNTTVVFNNVYGWHYSKIPSLGIWRTARIQNQASVEIENPFITTVNTKGLMNLNVVLKAVSGKIDGQLLVSVLPDNFKSNEQSFKYDVSSEEILYSNNFSFTIKDPQLWWPNDMGEQNLYKIKISFVPNSNATPDYSETTFGIRTVTMAPLPGGPYSDKYNWTFVINDKPSFMKGNGWCTMDPLMDFSRERYDRLLSLAKLQHIQMMRAWGSGMPETDDFYDLCDRYGILIIQDWPTAWNSHNSQPFDVLQETIELTTIRIRNHPSLVMYGGGNESDNPFGKAIDMFGRLSIELDGTRPFHRGQPWGGSNHNYMCWWVDAHLDYNLTMTSSFWGEFGLPSFPVKESILRYMPESELTEWPPDSGKSFVHHTPCFGMARDMQKFTQYSGYVMPNDNMDNFVIGSQLAQVVGVRHTLERSRTRWPETTGALYYKMNDNYPAASWACVDWYGVPKPIHYFAQDAFSPIAAVILFDNTDMYGKKISLPVFLLDDNLSLKDSNWKVNIRAFDQNLNKIINTEFEGDVNQKTVNKLGELSLTPEQMQTAPIFFVAEVLVDNKLAFRTFYFMNFEKEKGSIFNLPKTTLSLVVEGNKAIVKNTGVLPAVGVNINSPGNADKFTASDNFFWLEAGEAAEVNVNIIENLTIDAWNFK
jgi:beta-mannosidase